MDTLDIKDILLEPPMGVVVDDMQAISHSSKTAKSITLKYHEGNVIIFSQADGRIKIEIRKKI